MRNRSFAKFFVSLHITLNEDNMDLIPLDENKLYYNISEVASAVGVSETLLRYWEKEFPQQIAPKKAARGVRKYTKEDVDKIRTIYDLVKVRGLKLAAARDVLKQNKQGTVQTLEVVNRLKQVKAELRKMKLALESM